MICLGIITSEDMVPVSPLTANVCTTHCETFSFYVSAIARHVQQCPWEIGSAGSERVGEEKEGWYTQRVKTARSCLGWL